MTTDPCSRKVLLQVVVGNYLSYKTHGLWRMAGTQRKVRLSSVGLINRRSYVQLAQKHSSITRAITVRIATASLASNIGKASFHCYAADVNMLPKPRRGGSAAHGRTDSLTSSAAVECNSAFPSPQLNDAAYINTRRISTMRRGVPSTD